MTLDRPLRGTDGPSMPDPSPDPDPDPDPGGPIPDANEPPLRAPGADQPPLRLPRDNPDVESEL